MLLLYTLLNCVFSLTTDELNAFSNTGCEVQYGAQCGDILTGTVAIAVDGSITTLTNNGIPDHTTCDSTFNEGQTCYTERLTTYFSAQTNSVSFPSTPTANDDSTCLGAGTVGYAINGVAIFSPYSRPCTDAYDDEAIGFDACMGHPQENGNYHYHTAPVCLNGYTDAYDRKEPFFVGVAYDGFPIYSAWDDNGDWIDNTKLDACHGYTPEDGTYRYIANDEFPYIIGCFRGTPGISESCHCSRRNLDEIAKDYYERSFEFTRQEQERRRLQGGNRPPSGGGTAPGTDTGSSTCDGVYETMTSECETTVADAVNFNYWNGEESTGGWITDGTSGRPSSHISFTSHFFPSETKSTVNVIKTELLIIFDTKLAERFLFFKR